MDKKTLRAGVDVGGTFTDVVVLDEQSGDIRAIKIPTDYASPVAPILAGVRAIVADQPIAVLHHATTLSTNAILEARLPTGALLTTAGFRDVLDIGRIQRPEEGIYDFNIDTPPPLIPRRRRLEVHERIGPLGEIIEPLDDDDLRVQLRRIAANSAIKTIAVSTLFSFINSAHERRIGEQIEAQLPGRYYSLSSDVAPEIREFERTSTVVLDALLKPILVPYLESLEQTLADKGISTTRIMMASGGLCTATEAADKPVNTINSGPAAGVLAAANLGRQLGIDQLISVDMGGTSLDIGVVEDGQASYRFEGKIAGYPIRIPAIDVAAVAAGGGSLAVVDELGYIQVDRESAGSDPGPACYGRGGKRPTITDSDVILGRLGVTLDGSASENAQSDDDQVAALNLSSELASNAMATCVAEPLAIGVDDAASAVLDVIQARMSKAIAANTLEKGLDIREQPLLVYGGAGPTHAVELAQALGMQRVIVPYFAGNFSAIGLLLCPTRCDESRMLLTPLTAVDVTELNRIIDTLDARARKRLSLSEPTLTTRVSAHLRYAGQGYDLALPVNRSTAKGATADDIAGLVPRFHELHERFYAYQSQDEVIELVQIRVSVIGPELEFPVPPSRERPTQITTPAESIYFTQTRSRHDARVIDRASMVKGDSVIGPARVQGEGSSTLIPPSWAATTDRFLNLDIRQQ